MTSATPGTAGVPGPTVLFVPGDRPDRAAKAVALADAVVLDLEDAVPVPQKARARELVTDAVRTAASTGGAPVWVRVNAAGEPGLLAADVAALATVADAVDTVVLPKVRSPADVATVTGLLAAAGARPVPVLATVEDAVGLRACWDVAAAPGVRTLLFGTVDLSGDLGVQATAEGLELLYARSQVVAACAAAGLPAPVDGPWAALTDEEGLAVSAGHARRLGFGAKVVLHPRQLVAVRAAFAPTAREVAWAREVVTAYDAALAEGVGVLQLADGTFVDVPVARRARAVLAAAATAVPTPTPTPRAGDPR